MKQSIGRTIHDLRKSKNITQDELGNAIGVSGQAISKWEAGGSPDIELIPKIADYFSVTTDYLFGCDTAAKIDIYELLCGHIAKTDGSKRFQTAFDFLWEIEKGLSGNADHLSLESLNEKYGDSVSQMLFDNGYTQMRLNKDFPYFFIKPQTTAGYRELIDSGIDYLSFFQLIGNKDIWDSLLMLYSRENKPFTIKLLEKNLQLTEEKAKEIIKFLLNYKLAISQDVELDDGIVSIYTFKPNPAFVSMLVFAREMITRPQLFNYWYENRSKPYFAK